MYFTLLIAAALVLAPLAAIAWGWFEARRERRRQKAALEPGQL